VRHFFARNASEEWRRLGLTPKEKAKIRYENARKLFGLK
jgi:predicted TIM-barrel fold metal-dependent hydrolase